MSKKRQKIKTRILCKESNKEKAKKHNSAPDGRARNQRRFHFAMPISSVANKMQC